MALTYTLGFDPFWYMADAYGKPLGGGGFYAASSLNPTVPRIVYQDPAGTLAWPTNTIITPNGGAVPNIILFDANGVQGPFYFQFDSSNPSNLYYIKFYDANGNPLNEILSYFPPSGGGGGGTIVTNYFIKNYVVNNAFLHNNAAPGTGIISATNGTVICPSNHAGLFSRFSDVQFLKNNTSATDVITVVNPGSAGSDFAPGLNPLTGDVTPEFYINFQTTGAGSAETQKVFQWPLDLHLKNLEQQEITLILWAKGVSGTQTISPFIWQDTGSGSNSPTVIAPVNINGTPETIETGSWQAYLYTYTIPSLSGITIGNCGDDATYLQIGMPLNNTCNISFTKPKVYLGEQATQLFPELQTYDDVDAICMSPRTGDVRVSLNSFAPYGWVPCNDGTIGNGSSNATSRANVDTFALFDLIWLSFNANQTLAPMFNSSGTPVAYGSGSIADFTAGNRISLTKVLGRALSSVGQPSSGGTGNSWPLGTAQGEEKHTLNITEMPSHTHSPTTGNFLIDTGGGGTIAVNTGANAVTQSATASTGGGGSHNTIQPTAYFNVFMKL
jgi:microcystin-dependent protein